MQRLIRVIHKSRYTIKEPTHLFHRHYFARVNNNPMRADPRRSALNILTRNKITEETSTTTIIKLTNYLSSEEQH